MNIGQQTMLLRGILVAAAVVLIGTTVRAAIAAAHRPALPASILMRRVDRGAINVATDPFSIAYLSDRQLQIFADTMRASGLLDSARYAAFMKAIAGHRITSSLDALSYLNHAVVIDLRALPDEPERYMPIAFRQIADVVPGFTFSDLRVERRITDTVDGIGFGNLRISMLIGGQRYEQTTFYAPPTEPGVLHPSSMLGDYYYEIVNQWLADQGAGYRLFAVGDETQVQGMVMPRPGRVGLILLRQGQDSLLYRFAFTVLTPSYESYDSLMAPGAMRRAIATWHDLGLFDHLDDTTIARATDRALSRKNTDINDVLRAFPDVIADIPLETEGEDSVYAEVLNEAAAITHGAFQPTDIHDDIYRPPPTSTHFSFSVGGTVYDTTLTMTDRWLDPSVFDLIDRAVHDKIRDGRFHLLQGDDASLIFLTDHQYQVLKARGLLLFDDSDADK